MPRCRRSQSGRLSVCNWCGDGQNGAYGFRCTIYFAYGAAKEALTYYQNVEKAKEACSVSVRFSKDEPVSETEETRDILPKYAALAEEEPELYGWVKIEGTPIDFPVMYTPHAPQKYLRLTLDEEYSMAGSVFMDERCSDKSDNQILYGHNLMTDEMFGSLLKYSEETYYQEHPTVSFDTIYEEREYQIVSVFYDSVHAKEYTGFKYYNFIDADSDEDLLEAVNSLKEKSLYPIDISVEPEDKLLTLSTCSYHTENGRFAVIAKLKKG